MSHLLCLRVENKHVMYVRPIDVISVTDVSEGTSSVLLATGKEMQVPYAVDELVRLIEEGELR